MQLLGDGSTDAMARDISALAPHSVVGAALAVEDDPTSGNVYGAQTRSATTLWLNNQYFALTALTSLSTTVLQTVYQRCTHKGKAPDLIAVNDTAWRAIWNLSKTEKWANLNAGYGAKLAYDLGFPQYIEFNQAAIVPSKCMTSSANGGLLSADLGRIYFFNTKDGLELRVDPASDFKVNEAIRKSGQKTWVQEIDWAGQMLAVNPRLNGVITYTP
jgi:hypothetical protein